MVHQADFVESARQGHRAFLLADEPGLGKTAQALMAAEASGAFPLLVVVPNVVKTNWLREVHQWLPGRRPTVVHGDGLELNAFSDVFIVNYDILDRHVGWLSKFDFRGMVVDEAHFIKNKDSQRSKAVQAVAKTIKARLRHPLLVALTGTPLQHLRTIVPTYASPSMPSRPPSFTWTVGTCRRHPPSARIGAPPWRRWKRSCGWV